MGPASRGGSSVSAGCPLSDISPPGDGIHSWTLTDTEFIGGKIFISPPLGKPGYPPGRAGQHHPCGKWMCGTEGGGNQK